MLLEHRKSQNEQVEDEQKLSDVFMKTLGYTGRYGCINTGYRIYLDIMTGENCRQFRLLTWTSFIVQFVQLLGGEGMGSHYFSQLQVSLFLEYMIIWRKIQVVINPLY